MKKAGAIIVALMIMLAMTAQGLAASALERNLDILEKYINNPKAVSQDNARKAFNWVKDYIGGSVETYIVNTGTKTFHRPTCRYAEQIQASKRGEYQGARDDLTAEGYEPCKVCNP